MATFVTIDLPVETIEHVKKERLTLRKLLFGKKKDDKKRLMDRGEEDSCPCSFTEWRILDNMNKAGFDI